MASRAALVVFLALTYGSVLLSSLAVAFIIEEIFAEDLQMIADGILQIENIYIRSWIDARPRGRLWGCIKINYTSGLSDLEKISIQDDVQDQLESKWYVDVVERNYIITIPEVPVPWPGFAIGELNVGLKTFNVGDITGSEGHPDGECDMRDVGLVSKHFGETVPPAPTCCDLAGQAECMPDGKVDMHDVSLVARHFGEHA